MDFETFLNSLIKIGEIKFFSAKNEDQNKIKSNNVLQMLLKHHIWPLYERVFGTPVILNFASKNQIIDKVIFIAPRTYHLRQPDNKGSPSFQKGIFNFNFVFNIYARSQ